MNYMAYVWKKKVVILMLVNIMKVPGYYVEVEMMDQCKYKWIN